MRVGEDVQGAFVAIFGRIEVTAEIVAAFISYNSVPISEVANQGCSVLT